MAPSENDNSNTTNDSKPSSSSSSSSSSIFPSWFSWVQFLQGMDDQRVDRLKQCEVLKEILGHCRAGTPRRPQLEDVPMGIRSVRYFHWRGAEYQQQVEQNSGHNHKNCVREEHALWTCRAVGVACGQDVVNLRDCFRNETPEKVLQMAPKTDYEGKEPLHTDTGTFMANRIPCQELQRKVGACVLKNTTALEERLRKRKDQQQ